MGDPIPMILTCPTCCARHIDEGEFATKPHHTHACQSCGMVWRPAIVPTVGVQFLPGFKNANEPQTVRPLLVGMHSRGELSSVAHERIVELEKALVSASCPRCAYDGDYCAKHIEEVERENAVGNPLAIGICNICNGTKIEHDRRVTDAIRVDAPCRACDGNGVCAPMQWTINGYAPIADPGFSRHDWLSGDNPACTRCGVRVRDQSGTSCPYTELRRG